MTMLDARRRYVTTIHRAVPMDTETHHVTDLQFKNLVTMHGADGIEFSESEWVSTGRLSIEKRKPTILQMLINWIFTGSVHAKNHNLPILRHNQDSPG